MIAFPITAYTQLKRVGAPMIACASGMLLLLLLYSLLGTSTSHPKTSLYYAIYILICIITIVTNRQTLLHPACLFVYASLLGFGLNIPLFCTNFFPGVHYDDQTMSGVCIIILTATAAALLGSLLLPNGNKPLKLFNFIKPHPNASTGLYILCLSAICVCGIVRIVFHLGEPGKQPSLPFAGVLQFIFYEGAIIIALWYLSRALQTSLLHITLALGLLASIALTQSLLGWRGGVFAMLIAGMGIFMLQDSNYRSRSPLWLGILGLSAVFLINLGNEIRAEKLGGKSEYAKDEAGFMVRTLYRAQGTSRLAEVVKYFEEITLTNNFLYKELAEKNLSATVFIDREVYDIKEYQSHSVGTSGPGGPYVNLGLAGVFLAYFSLGLFFKFIFNQIQLSNPHNPTAKIIYSYMILIAIQTQSENFGLLAVKCLFAISVLGLGFNYLIQFLFQESRGSTLSSSTLSSSTLSSSTISSSNIMPENPPKLFQI